MKKHILVFLSFFISFNLFAEVYEANQSVMAFTQALISYDNMDYGTALKYSEDAILYRKQFIENQINTLKNSLTAKRVQVAEIGRAHV